MIRADRVNLSQYTLMALLDPENILKETLKKTCLFYYKDAIGIGLMSALEFLDDEQASELVESFAKKTRG